MTAFRPVARVDDLPRGTLRAVEVDGTGVLLARVGDDVYALEPECRHLQGPLAEGVLEDCVLTCPWHGWQYDVRTGENEFDRAIALASYAVRVEDGVVSVAL